MNKIVLWVSVLLAFLILFWIFVHYAEPKAVIQTAENRIMFFVEVSRTPAEQARGLMYRPKLAQNRGMLFDFGSDRTLNFWMKNTLVPLDVIFAAADGRIVSVRTMVPCLEEDCPIYSSGEPARYALEINGGLAEKFNIREGDRLIPVSGFSFTW